MGSGQNLQDEEQDCGEAESAADHAGHTGHRAENAGRSKAHMLMAVAKSNETAGAPDWWRLASSVPAKESQR